MVLQGTKKEFCNSCLAPLKNLLKFFNCKEPLLRVQSLGFHIDDKKVLARTIFLRVQEYLLGNISEEK